MQCPPGDGSVGGGLAHVLLRKTGPDGKFRIEGIPAGSYTVQIWHEKLIASAAAVTVPAEGTATIAFALAK